MSKSPSLRRIQADIRELSLDPSDQYYAAPLENDMFEWHFTIRGAADTVFAGGMYHGRILLPPEYPFKPPHIVFLTPSGRFETHTKICLSFSAFHPELWQPAWGIRLILEALIAFLPSPADGAIGALDWSAAERKRLAKASQEFHCPSCGKIADLLPPLKEGAAASKPSRFQKEIEQLQRFQSQEHKEDGDKKEQTERPAALAETDSATTPASVNEPSSAVEAATAAQGVDDAPPTPTLDSEAAKPAAKPTPQAEPASTPTDNGSSAYVNDSPAPFIPESAPSTPVVNNANVLNEPVPAVEQEEQPIPKPSLLTETSMQLAIVVLSVACFLLLRKIQALCAELEALED